jgi:hypothetical protein
LAENNFTVFLSFTEVSGGPFWLILHHKDSHERRTLSSMT